MKKWIVLALALMVSCTKSQSIVKDEHRVVVDQMGREVMVPAEASRVVSGFTYPYVSAWFVATGLGEEMVGMHPSSYSAMEYSILSQLSPALLNASTSFIGQGEINTEELLKLQPDVYVENFAFGQNIEKVSELGIPTVALKTMTQADGNPFVTMQSWLDFTATMMPSGTRVERFAQLSQEVQEEVAQTLEGLTEDKRPRVLMIHSHDERSIMVYGARIWGNYWITTAGGTDVAQDDVVATQEVSMEQIYRWNPDIIIISNFTETHPMELLNNTINGQDWSVVKAVQNGAVYKIPLGVYRWSTPSGDAPLMLKWMAQTLHPELFSYDMAEEIKNYYQNFYNYELTNDDIERILYPAPESSRSELTLYINRLIS